MTALEYGLGRLYVPDDRDENYPMREVVPSRTDRTYRYWWPSGWWGNQKRNPWCVAYAWRHWIEDGPVAAPGEPTFEQLRDSYHWMQRNDRWIGESYDGTSVRAGAKFWQAQGAIGEYRWGWNLDVVVRALLETGPVVLGTNWYQSMSKPTSDDGVMEVSGLRIGGHAYLANGVNVRRERIRIKNSWSRSWGRRGYAWLRFADAERLIRENGEACLPTAA